MYDSLYLLLKIKEKCGREILKLHIYIYIYIIGANLGIIP